MEVKRTLAALLLAVSAVQWAPAAAAQPGAGNDSDRLREARSRFERGVELYEEGDMDAALVELRRAYELAPSYKLLFNIGQVHLQKTDYASALDAFERYLAQGGENLPAKRRREIEALIAKLRQRVAKVRVTVNVEGAEVLVDDLPRGTAPLHEPLVINAGNRKLSAQAPGYDSAVKHIEAAGAESLTVHIELSSQQAAAVPALAPAPAAAAPKAAPRRARPEPRPQPEPAPASAPEPEKAFPWAAWVATGVLTAGAITVGAFAYDASRDLDRKRAEQGVSRKDLDDATERTEQLALATDIVGGAAVLTGALSLYLTLSPAPAAEGPEMGSWRGIKIGASGRF